jgi:preprotein translocase subunit SecD
MILKILKNWRVITLIIFVLFALLAIRPTPGNDGVAIRAVELNSSASDAGIPNPAQKTGPLNYERIVSIDNVKISSLDDYVRATSNLAVNDTIRVISDRASYILTTRPLVEVIELNETEFKVIEEFNEETNTTETRTIQVPKIREEIVGVDDLGFTLSPAATSNLRKGLDLAGGSRVLLEPQEAITQQDLETIIESLTQRLNVYGLSDVVVRDATDLSGKKFILVEIAGVTEEEVRDVIARQGKFEAKIGNETVFIGGNKDVTYVCRTAECSGLNPQQPCFALSAGSYSCGFFFSIALSGEAAQRHADVTSTIDVVADGNQRYLAQPLDLFLDDTLVDTLQIHANLKGQLATNIQISGSGSGTSQTEAASDALDGMKRLQTILITGSLPVKLNIVKMDTVSPLLGDRFLKNILYVGLGAILSVAAVVSIRYRSLKVAIPMIITMLSELIMILGFAALVGWNLDLAAMAGIIITIGTAVDHLIVITDETLRGSEVYDWKRRLKSAMFIIIGAYLTVLAGMLPLWFAGAGLLKGFAFTTIVGVSFGVFIARPAYAAMLKVLVKG